MKSQFDRSESRPIPAVLGMSNIPVSSGALVASEPRASQSSEIVQILRLAVESKVDVDTIERLTALVERMNASSAATEFNYALAAFQSECPSIPKTSVAKITSARAGVEYGYKYAELDQIAKITRPLLTKHGLSYTWDSDLVDGKVLCTCTLRHVSGHSQTAKFSAPTDTAASMSGPQKNAAALTYARRQALIQVLGLTTTDPDTDAGAPRPITSQQVFDLEDLAKTLSADDRGRFLKYMEVETIADISVGNFGKAHSALVAKSKGGAK